MQAGIVVAVAIVFLVIVLNLFFFVGRAMRSGSRKKGRDRHYVPPEEIKQAQWRDKEIARRIEREQDDAYERVKLRNETLALYETVRQKHAREETIERLERLHMGSEDYELDYMKGIVSGSSHSTDARDDEKNSKPADNIYGEWK